MKAATTQSPHSGLDLSRREFLAIFGAVAATMSFPGCQSKERASMDHLRSLPVENPGELSTLVIDQRAREIRAIGVS
jgi:hypothetical protein